MASPLSVAVLASGGGTNFQALLDAAAAGHLGARIGLLVASKPDIGAIERARSGGVPHVVLSPTLSGGTEGYARALLAALEAHHVDVVVLAGHLLRVPTEVLRRFPNRVLNIHPSLLPAFGGQGMYGHKVHEAVLASGARISGCTVHLVDDAYDHGPAILQRAVDVLDTDTPQTLAERILPHEHALLVRAVQLMAQGRVTVENGRVHIRGQAPEPRVKRALLSVSDKTGIVAFARGLHERGVELLSTGGTAKQLRAAGLPVRSVEAFTGSAEMLDGRVKTLHPRVHGALLYRRDVEDHVRQVGAFGLEDIDLVAVNLYPFAAAARKHAPFSAELMEEIDIGGPAMVRAAAKNCASVTVVVNPEDQARVLEEISQHGRPTEETRRFLAARAYQHTAEYDTMVAGVLSAPAKEAFPPRLTLNLERVQALRYGENPHQPAALYRPVGATPSFRQLHGKELSFNNLLDAQGAWEAAQEFADPGVVIFKHVTPCGAATGPTLAEAYVRALACDPLCAFGGIVAVNRPLDEATARAVGDLFLEVVVAPSFTPEALALLQRKKNVRLMEHVAAAPGAILWRSVGAELLAQGADDVLLPTENAWKVVSRRAPTADEERALRFAWAVCKHVRSNAITVTGTDQVLGLGTGQMSRVDSVAVAGIKMRQMAERVPLSPLKVGASDAFFPFRDGLDALAGLGVSAVIQPGGSVRDEEVIAAADAHGLAMVMTGMRHFRH